MKKYFACFLALLLTVSLVPAQPARAQEAAATAVYDVLTQQPPHCKAAVLMDADTGDVLYSWRAPEAEEHSYPASTTKIMTCMLILEAVDRGELSLDQVITASSTFGRDLVSGGSTQGIKEGEQLTLRDLLYCALLPSANEACNIMAEALDGDITVFVERMNARAAELGMADTHYVNTHGLHKGEHYTTAYDLALLTRQALQNDTFREIVSSKSYTVPETNLRKSWTVTSTNALINPLYSGAYTYPKAIGVKTGTTSEAGRCLVSAAVGKYQPDSGTPGKANPPATLICVVLGSEEVKGEDGSLTRYQFAESKRLLQWGFDSFSRKTIVQTTDPVTEIPVDLSADTTAVAVKPQETLEVILPADVDPAGFQREVTLYAPRVDAPVTEGQEVGEMAIRDGEKTYAVVKLVAAASAQRNSFLGGVRKTQDFFSQTWVKVLLVIAVLAVVALILRFCVFKPRAGYHGKNRRERSHQNQSQSHKRR